MVGPLGLRTYGVELRPLAARLLWSAGPELPSTGKRGAGQAGGAGGGPRQQSSDGPRREARPGRRNRACKVGQAPPVEKANPLGDTLELLLGAAAAALTAWQQADEFRSDALVPFFASKRSRKSLTELVRSLLNSNGRLPYTVVLIRHGEAA